LSRADAREQFGLPVDVPLIVSTGRITRAKNQIALLGALDRTPEAHLAIAGIGAAEDDLRQAAVERGTSDRLHLVGELRPDEIYSFLAAGDVFAFASLTETFGLSVVEAAIAGLPIVSNDLPVLREVLSVDGQSAAIFANADDEAQFSDAIASLLGDHSRAAALTKVGRQIAERYRPEAMCAAYEAVLSEPVAP
jgi:glycosyltransferase involved in cell wall biosynthesis